MGNEQKSNVVVCSAIIREGRVSVSLSDGREVSTPIEWYPKLAQASQSDLDDIEISPLGLHWEKLDEDLSLAGMLVGRRSPPTELPSTRPVAHEQTEYREQRRLSLLADAYLDYPEQQDCISRFVNE